MNISCLLPQMTLSWIKISKKGKICEYFLEAVIVFIVLDLSAPRLKARPLRHPVGCGLRNGKWRKPEMSRILRQIVIRTTFGTWKTPASSVSWKWLQPAHVSVVQIDKTANLDIWPHIGAEFSWCNVLRRKSNLVACETYPKIELHVNILLELNFFE